jgi:hypothetical protein
MVLTAAALAFIGAIAPVGHAFGADPTAPPGTPTCFERYETPGPGGIDLRLTCLANELVGTFTDLGNPSRTPTAVIVTTVGALVAGLLVVFVVWRLLRRGAGRRLASETPAAWWICPACRSLNAPTAAACYACASPWTPDAAVAAAASAASAASAATGTSGASGASAPSGTSAASDPPVG